MSQFQKIINSDVPVLVDFYATWCGPCKMINPIIEQVAKSVQGKAKVIKIDVDKNKHAATVYNVRGVPTLILFKNGKQVWKQSGVVQAHQLIQIINQNL